MIKEVLKKKKRSSYFHFLEEMNLDLFFFLYAYGTCLVLLLKDVSISGGMNNEKELKILVRDV